VESTLAMFAHKVREKRLTIEREFAPSLPPIAAFGGELNQVWTNLLDNAIDAARSAGTWACAPRAWGATWWSRSPTTARRAGGAPRPDLGAVLHDEGRGRGHGLGLDIARRIVVRQHGGELALDTAAGRTRFTVRLPTQPGATFESTPIEQGGGL
jgi:signal transduction histidine kinase